MGDCSGDAESNAPASASSGEPFPEPTPDSYVMTSEHAGRRLDTALAEVAEVPRAQVRRWIEEGLVEVDGHPARPSTKISAGMTVCAQPPETAPARVLAEDLPLAVLHEDEDLLVLDKAAGMVVHPAPGHHSGTLVNALLHHFRSPSGGGPTVSAIGGVERPGIVHRLDRGTSGVMVVAKNDAAHVALAEQFQDHSIERLYRVFVRALPSASSGRVDRAIGRHTRDRKKMSVRTRRGRAAVTHWTVEERFPMSGTCLLSIRPETGRTHQIRVHLSASGMPVAGDPVYGRRSSSRRRLPGQPELERPALHAEVLGFVHPTSGERMRFAAPLPSDLAALLAWLRGREPAAPGVQ